MRDFRWTIDEDITTKVNLLLVEDNDVDAKLFKTLLRKRIGKEIELFKADSLKEAKEFISKGKIDIVFLDLNLPDSNADFSFFNLHEFTPDIPVVILSGIKDRELMENLIRAGAQDYLIKGNYTDDLLFRTIRFALKRNQLLKENKSLLAGFSHLINNIDLSVFVINNEKRILFVDDSVSKLLGVSKSELIGKNFPLPFKIGKSIEKSLKPMGKENTFVEIQAYKSVWKQKPVTVVTLEDISEDKRIKEKLKRLEQMRFATMKINQLIVRAENYNYLFTEALNILNNTKLFEQLEIYVNIVNGENLLFSKKNGKKVKIENVQSDYIFRTFGFNQTNSDDLLELKTEDGSGDVYYIKALKNRNKTFGFLIAKSSSPKIFNSEEKELLTELANDIGYAVYSLNLSKKLSDSENRFKDFFEQSLTGNFISSADGKLIACNSAYLQIFGFSSQEEAAEYQLTDLYPKLTDRKALLDLLGAQKSLQGYELNMQKITGESITVEANIKGEYDHNGKLERIIGHVNDITEKKKNLDKLIENETKFRKLSDNLPIAIGIIQNDKFIYFNRSAQELAGYSQTELYSMNMWEMLDEEDVQRLKYILKSGLKYKNNIREYELKINTKFGYCKWIDITATKFQYENEEAILFTALDVSQRKRAESEILKLSQAVHQSPVSILITDKDGTIEYVNNYFTEVTGYSAVEVIGENPRILQSGKTKKSEYLDLWNTLNAGNTWKGEFINKRKNGEYFTIKATISPIKDRKGNTTHFVALQEDITEMKKTISELIKAREEAQKAERLKSEFIAQISHEIRTPLNPIMSYTGYLREELKDKMDSYLESIFTSIEKSGKRLIRTVELLIHNSELNVGSYKRDVKMLDIKTELLEPVYYDYLQLAKSKGLKFEVEAPEELKLNIDETAINQIIVNLVDNAIKYTSKGIVKLITEKKNDKILIKVSDTGIGIAKEYLPNLFKPFSQEDTGYTRRFDGTGLGMSLVNEFCKLNDIDIDVKSEKGKGTLITLTINISGDQSI